jgi:peptidyl-prolyl cis-trans isomerase D
MISQFRKYTDSWIARIFFILMAVSFVGWGISGDLFRIMGSPTWVAKVGSQTIETQAFEAEFQRALAQQTKALPPNQEPPAGLRRQVGQQTLERMVGQLALEQELKSLRIVTPDDALAAAARAMPAFQGTDGKFSKDVFTSVLRNNGYTEARFLAELRTDISQKQLLSTLSAPVPAPEAEVKPLYAAEFEKRSADMASFPLDAAPEPATPDEAALKRWYENHPDSYTTPEYRRIKAIELSPESLASDIKVTDQELQAAYDEHKAEFVTPEKRSAEVISARQMAGRRGLGGDPGGRDRRRCVGHHPGRCTAGRVSRSGPRQGGVRGPGRRDLPACEGRAGLVRGEGDKDHPRQDHQLRAGQDPVEGPRAGQQGG